MSAESEKELASHIVAGMERAGISELTVKQIHPVPCGNGDIAFVAGDETTWTIGETAKQ